MTDAEKIRVLRDALRWARKEAAEHTDECLRGQEGKLRLALRVIAERLDEVLASQPTLETTDD